MSSPAVPSRSADLPGRALGLLSALAVALAAAFVVGPRLPAGWPGGGFADQRVITAALRPAFVEFWRSGDRELPPHLHELVDYWSRYHVIEAVTATLLLIVIVALGITLWTAFLRAGGLRVRAQVTLASGAVVTTTSRCSRWSW